MSSAITAASVVVLAVILWVIYYVTFLDPPPAGVTTLFVGFAALIVFTIKWLIGRSRWREKNQ